MAIAEKIVEIETLNKRLAYMNGQLGDVQREIEIKEEIIKGLISDHGAIVQVSKLNCILFQIISFFRKKFKSWGRKREEYV